MVDFRSMVPWRERSQSPAARNDIFDPFVSFRRELDRAFNSFFDGFGPTEMAHWAGPTPALDVQEKDKELVVTVELPGVSEKDVEVTLSGDVLTVKGEKKAENSQKNGDLSYVERRYGAFSRSLRLPFEVKDENVDATYDQGVLTIRIPRQADSESPVRKIEVKST